MLKEIRGFSKFATKVSVKNRGDLKENLLILTSTISTPRKNQFFTKSIKNRGSWNRCGGYKGPCIPNH